MIRFSRARILGAAWALALGASLACTDDRPSSVSPPPTITWIQIWSDEIDGPAGARVDNTKWSYDTADRCSGGTCGWGNDEKEYYTDSTENIALNGQGQLIIGARRATAAPTSY